VDLVGLTELPKHITIDYVLKLVDNLILLYQLLILPHVVASSAVFLWDVTEDKSELLGLGSRITESLLEETGKILPPVILIPCNNALTMSLQPNIQIVLTLNRMLHLVSLVALEIMLIITLINTKLALHIH
jgi:hypothetical protein